MTADSLERSTLEPEQVMIARLAALVAVDAPAISYLLNLSALEEMQADVDLIQGVFLAVAPIVGTARVTSAASKIMQALGLAVPVSEQEGPEED
jgi:hypothetical protein